MCIIDTKNMWEIYLIKYDWVTEDWNSCAWKKPTIVTAELIMWTHCYWCFPYMQAKYDWIHYDVKNTIVKTAPKNTVIKALKDHRDFAIKNTPKYKDKIKKARDDLILNYI